MKVNEKLKRQKIAKQSTAFFCQRFAMSPGALAAEMV